MARIADIRAIVNAIREVITDGSNTSITYVAYAITITFRFTRISNIRAIVTTNLEVITVNQTMPSISGPKDQLLHYPLELNLTRMDYGKRMY